MIAGDGSNANSNSSPTASAVGSAQPTTSDGALSADELYQLTLYKWRYSLEAFGFDDREVRELMFLKWLHTSRRVVP